MAEKPYRIGRADRKTGIRRIENRRSGPVILGHVAKVFDGATSRRKFAVVKLNRYCNRYGRRFSTLQKAAEYLAETADHSAAFIKWV